MNHTVFGHQIQRQIEPQIYDFAPKSAQDGLSRQNKK